MTSWIDLDALWKIVVIGLLCGAGLPAVFAVGLRALSLSERRAGAAAPVSVPEAALIAPVAPGLGGGDYARPRTARAGAERVAAGLCFAAVLAAIGWGVAFIVSHG
ncbi:MULTISPECIES: hypothetical protein [Pseudofrankia]|uniref:hypothetical protein n=1 Tax=Pseudofrankia TaxID=2994363 RepID=UPI000234C031|nr:MULTISPECIES: hypothetical protein [Pseudofrankia]OHV32423.1 hypothetical protein BCD49_29725 [Pseudofrankia sp. EUN1h]